MLQQMPRDVTVAPPSFVTSPLADAVKGVIEDIAVVFTVGKEGGATGVVLSFLQLSVKKIRSNNER